MSSVEVRQPWYLRAQGFCPTTQALVAWYVLLKKDKGRDADPCMHAQSLSHVNSLQPQWTIACQAPLSVGFPRQEYWSGLPFPHLFNSFPALCFKDLYSSAEDFKFVSVLYHRVIASHVWLCKFKLNWKFHSSVGPVTFQVLCKHMSYCPGPHGYGILPSLWKVLLNCTVLYGEWLKPKLEKSKPSIYRTERECTLGGRLPGCVPKEVTSGHLTLIQWWSYKVPLNLADSEPDLSASEKKEQGTYDNQASLVWVLKLEHQSVDTEYKPSLPKDLALRPSGSHIFSSSV